MAGGNAAPGTPNQSGTTRECPPRQASVGGSRALRTEVPQGEPQWEVAGRGGRALMGRGSGRGGTQSKKGLWRPPPSSSSSTPPATVPRNQGAAGGGVAAGAVPASPAAPTEAGPPGGTGSQAVAPRGVTTPSQQGAPAPPAALGGASVGPGPEAGADSAGAAQDTRLGASWSGSRKEVAGDSAADHAEETGLVFVDEARLDADAWRGRMVGEIVKGGGARLGGCSALRWLRQDAMSLRAAG